MEAALWIALAIVAALVVFLGLHLRKVSRRSEELAQQLTAGLRGLSEQVGNQLGTTANLLQRQESMVGDRLSKVQDVVGEVKERLGALAETGRKLTDLAQDLASLQEILRAPKARGAFGEWLLADLLAEVLPQDRFSLQHRLRSGTIVDAAIFLEGLVVPVDAKFPGSGLDRLASVSPEERAKVNRELVRNAQKHVDTIAAKYIRPEEGTTDFALMYIPAEGIYIELLASQDQDFLTYAWEKRVVPCSPNTFYAYLRSVALGLRGLALAKDVQTVLGELRGLEGAVGRMAEEMDILGNHLRSAQRKHEEVGKLVQGVREKLGQLAHPKEAT